MGSDALLRCDGEAVSRIAAAGIVTFMALAGPAFAQVDLSGQWGAINQQDNMARGAGPDLADYTGLPINDEARTAALSYTSGVLSMTERGCMDYTENYLLFAPHNIVIERVNDPVTGDVLAWRVSAGGSDRAPITIWMDGRPHPSPLAVHSFSGFTTGEWVGDRLTARMTHMKRGIMRRNGVPLSDRATLTLHFVRHGDRLDRHGHHRGSHLPGAAPGANRQLQAESAREYARHESDLLSIHRARHARYARLGAALSAGDQSRRGNLREDLQPAARRGPRRG